NTNITIKEGKADFVQFSNQVAPIVDYFTPTEAELASFLSINQAHIDSKKYNTRLISCGVPYLIVPIYYYQTVREAKFDYSAWSQSIAPQTAAQEILLFSTKTTHPESDFHVRLVGPKIGPQEDPPVGSAMPAFAAYLSSFDHLQKGTYTFVVDRGDESVRRSVINLEMDHKGEEKLTLRVGGEAVIVAQGSLAIPEGSTD
ncbi:MAG: PhzF family phenazine biosynthesis protein, partial [Thiotrichaceae bacterium]|nr:PhzF family phenazine biosynthesis protein [Thiotrichaceae bacterium]